MSAFPMQEVYEMDGIAVHPVHRLSPIYQQQQVLAPGHHHVPITPGMPLLPVHHQHRMMQPSASTYDGRVMTTTPVLTYQTSPQPPQSTYTTVVYPQPVLVIDPLSAPQFQDRIVKMDYIRKVLGVLFTQIGLCFLIVNVFNLRSIKDWTQSNIWFLIIASVSAVVVLTLLACFAESHQDCPVNSILTGFFTLSASLTIGASSTFPFYESSLNLMYFFDVTLIISFALIFSLILYAFQSNYDFNLLNCIRYVVLIVTVFMVIYLALIVIWSDWLARILPTIFYAVTCGLAFTLYVITDLTFMIHRCYYNGLTADSVMLAVIYLHTDIINPNGNFWGRC